MTTEIDDLIEPVLDHLDDERPGELVGVYVYGSGAVSGLRPDSDVDLLMLTRRSLTRPERTSLTALLLATSGWHGHEARFPEAADRRPLDVTSLVVGDVQPLSGLPRRDFQYGEWLREQLLGGPAPLPSLDPDVVTLLATALKSQRVFRGPELEALIDPVPSALLAQAQLAAVPHLLSGLVGDERNSLLTLARILVTVETGQIVPKHLAAERVAPRLRRRDRALLELAREDYLGRSRAAWRSRSDSARACARSLAALIREAARVADC